MFCISVPVKTNARYLKSALASLRGQDSACAVSLLDASGDPVVSAVADASGLEFSWRRHGPDSGQAGAIVEGWQNAAGDILGWLNDDDQLLPGTLSEVARIYETEPETDIVYGHAVMLDESGAFTGYFPSISDNSEDLRFSNVICQPACFVRRRAVESVGGLNTAQHFVMDWDLWLRLLESGARFRFADRPLAAVRSHAATKTRSGGQARWREIEKLMTPRLSVGELWRLRLGFARSEARDNDRGFKARAIEAVLRAGRLRRSALSPDLPIFGLGRSGNRVEGSCTIVIPVDHTDGVVDMNVVTDRRAELHVAVGDVRRQSVSVRKTASGPGFDHKVCDVPVELGLLVCQMETAGEEWGLIRVSVETEPVRDAGVVPVVLPNPEFSPESIEKSTN